MRPFFLGFAGLALFLGSLVVAPLTSEVAYGGPAHVWIQDNVVHPEP